MQHTHSFIESIIDRAVQHDTAFIDFFCGFGGVTEGIERTNSVVDKDGNIRKVATVIACLNHDHKAINTHKIHHPHALHLEEDFRTASTETLEHLVKQTRQRSNGKTRIAAWLSFDCTHHSGAKGGDSRDEDSRSLAEDIFRYLDAFSPDDIWVENVKEFLTWGPCEPKMKTVESGGVKYEVCLIKYKKANKKKGTPLQACAWMVPVKDRKAEYYNAWVKKIKEYGYSYEYRILDCADYGCPTMRKRLFIQFKKDGAPISWPKPTHSKKPTLFTQPHIPIKDCLDFSNTGESLFAFKMNPKGKKNKRFKSPKTYKRVADGLRRHVLPFLTSYYGNAFNTPIESTSPTLACKNVPFLIQPCFIHKNYRGADQHQSINRPGPTLTCNPKGDLVTIVPAYLMSTHFNNLGSGLNEVAPTLTANRKHHYLINMQFNNTGHSIEKPSPTLIATMDSKPNYITTVVEGKPAIMVYADDSPEEIELKQLMAEHGIADIYIRELTVAEMLKITTMDPETAMLGNKTDHKKFIGNAVPPEIVKALVYDDYDSRNRNYIHQSLVA